MSRCRLSAMGQVLGPKNIRRRRLKEGSFCAACRARGLPGFFPGMAGGDSCRFRQARKGRLAYIPATAKGDCGRQWVTNMQGGRRLPSPLRFFYFFARSSWYNCLYTSRSASTLMYSGVSLTSTGFAFVSAGMVFSVPCSVLGSCFGTWMSDPRLS